MVSNPDQELFAKVTTEIAISNSTVILRLVNMTAPMKMTENRVRT